MSAVGVCEIRLPRPITNLDARFSPEFGSLPTPRDTSLKILVLHGPNLNLLGRREPEVYGSITLAEIDEALQHRAGNRGVELRSLQSNREGVLIDALHRAMGDGTDAVVLNAGGYTHSSVALRDAVVGCGIPVIEVHLSNTAAREGFRKRSLIAPVACGSISGFGLDSYLLGLDAAVATVRKSS
jgi:3-dehydroquinate dehydratase-2